MRIAYVLTSLGVGGAERQVLALAERMAARGHAVSLVVLLGRQAEEWPTPCNLDRFVRLDMSKTPASFLTGLWKARRFLRDFQPDLIHSHTYPANMTARLLRLVSFVPFGSATAPIVSTIHNVYEGHWPRMLAYRLADPLSRRTTAVSQAAADRFVRLKAVPARKCSVLTNGIDTAEFAPSPERRARARAEMGAGDEFIWLAVGRIVPAKDYPNLLRAFAQVHAAFPAVRLWVAGEAAGAVAAGVQQAAEIRGTSGEIGEERPSVAKASIDSIGLTRGLRPRSPSAFGLFAACQAMATELGLGASVRWLGLRRDMPALLDAADGFVLASAWEGMPLALGEAMAMEKPVVATHVGGVREIAGDCGVIIPAGSPETLAQAMLGMMRATPEARHSLGLKARERIATHFSIDAKADEWEALYRKVLEAKI